MIARKVNAPKYAESIPAVTSPVKLPRLVPGRARFLANVVTGGVLAVVAIVAAVYGIAVIA
ncbi:hypothetical protein [Microbacterium sp. XT11]|uniref:hypothetical protein n=1 Tax=Microbacterium sp. XT11 TaxID=367477 RepID=UPI0008379153|nr:hypothetical protein [Microbacterium sp. XT11]